MIFKIIIQLSVLVIFLFQINLSTSLSCYQCDGELYSPCGVNFDVNSDQVTKVVCKSTATKCFVKYTKNNGQIQSVIRGCANSCIGGIKEYSPEYKDSNNEIRTGLLIGSGLGCCSNDLCNKDFFYAT